MKICSCLFWNKVICFGVIFFSTGFLTYSQCNDFFIQGNASATACKDAIEDVVWVRAASNLRNTISGNSLTKSSSNGSWNGNGFSHQSVSNNGYMQTTVAETNTDRVIGLSSTDVNTAASGIQFAFKLQSNGVLGIVESNNNRGSFGYASGDVLKIAVENNVVKYYRNGTILYISTVTPTLPLFVDVSTFTIGATANNVKIANGYNSTFTAVGTDLGTAPVYQWKRNGLNVGTNSASYSNPGLVNDDVVTCVVTPDLGGCTGSAYTSNAISIRDIDITTQNTFYIAAAPASSACKEALVDVSWVIASSTQRNRISANSLTKVSGGGAWDGNGFSHQSVSNNGYMQTTVSETNTERMIGLSATDANSSFASIQFAFYLQSTGALRIYQSGLEIGTVGFGTYASGDVLKIAVENNVVKYYRNGTVLFTSTVAPVLPLFVDVSTFTTGATANDVKIANGYNSTFTAVGTGLGTAPTYQWKLNGANVGINSTTYSNAALVGGNVISCIVIPDLGGCSGNAFTSNNITILEPSNSITTWIGTTNAWNTAANWSNGVPTKYTTAVINTGVNPVISTNAVAYGITIGSGRSLTINNSSLTLELYGNFTNQGTFTANNSTVAFYGCSSANTITSTSLLTFNNLLVENINGVNFGGTTNVDVNGTLNLTYTVVSTGVGVLNLNNSTVASLSYTSGFVNGNLRRRIASNTSTYFYPIGNGVNSTDRHLGAIINNNLVGVMSITGSVTDFNQVAPNNDAYLNTRQQGTFIDATIGETVGQSVIWRFTPNSAPTGGSYGVRLYTENTTLSAADDNMFCPLKRSNTTTFSNFLTLDATTSIPLSNSAGRVYNNGSGYAQRTGYTGFSEFVIGKSTLGPLPIELIFFKALCINGLTELYWSTATENNNDFFTIEKSRDGLNFEVLANISGAGNSTQVLQYEFVDQSANEVDILYYRLKQTDYNGSYTYSEIVSVDCISEIADRLSVYPNPGKHELTIQYASNSSEKTSFSILNSNGILVLRGMVNKLETINTDHLAPGLYLVVLENGESCKWVKE